jgi:hypothetical protein
MYCAVCSYIWSYDSNIQLFTDTKFKSSIYYSEKYKWAYDIKKIQSWGKYNSSESSPSMHWKEISHKIFTALAIIYIFFVSDGSSMLFFSKWTFKNTLQHSLF